MRVRPTYKPSRGVVQANIPPLSMFALQTEFKLGSGLFPTVIDAIPILLKQQSILIIITTDLIITNSASWMFSQGTSVAFVRVKVSKLLSTELLPANQTLDIVTGLRAVRIALAVEKSSDAIIKTKVFILIDFYFI